MALSKIDAANFLTGTIPQGNVANASLNAVTSLPAGVGGKVLQVVQGTPDTTVRESNSTSFVTASNTIFVNITPSATSSKIYVLASGGAYGSTATYNSLFTIYRDSTNLSTDSYNIVRTNDDNSYGNYCMSFLDSPSSTSQIKYQVYFKSEGSANTIRLNSNGTQGLITAFKIAG